MPTGTTVNGCKIKKQRVAIGLFDKSSNLGEALEALIDDGFSVVSLCVFATESSVRKAWSMLHYKAKVDPALAALFFCTDSYKTLEGMHPIVGSQGRLFSRLNVYKQNRHSDGYCDNCGKISAELVVHIERGDFVLVVDVDEPRQLIHATKIMLKFSHDIVQTHEILLS